MNILEIIFLGCYHVLDKTIYSNGHGRSIGPKEHAFFIAFLFHGINIWTLISYVLANFFLKNTPLYAGLSIGIAVFVVGYLSFFKRKADEVVAHRISNLKAILFVLIAVIYIIISTYFMFKVGDYIREMSTKN